MSTVVSVHRSQSLLTRNTRCLTRTGKVVKILHKSSSILTKQSAVRAAQDAGRTGVLGDVAIKDLEVALNTIPLKIRGF